MRSAIILAAAAIVAAAIVWSSVVTGRYTMSSTQSARHDYVFVLDRVNGEVRRCDETECKVLQTRDPPPARETTDEWWRRMMPSVR